MPILKKQCRLVKKAAWDYGMSAAFMLCVSLLALLVLQEPTSLQLACILLCLGLVNVYLLYQAVRFAGFAIRLMGISSPATEAVPICCRRVQPIPMTTGRFTSADLGVRLKAEDGQTFLYVYPELSCAVPERGSIILRCYKGTRVVYGCEVVENREEKR